MTGRDVLRFRFAGCESNVHFTGSLEQLEIRAAPDAVFLFDTKTSRLFARHISGHRAGAEVVLPRGERSKCWGSAEKVIRRALEQGLGRDGVIVGVGGGVICDLAAFSASLFMRGCRLLLVPTTLLAMVDAAFGGKTAINLGGHKNMVGTFYPAEQIWICAGVLASLSDRELRSGLAEAIKTAFLGDEGLLEILTNERGRILAREPGVMEELVRRCLAVKGRIVEPDLRESGPRALLNLGHTFAHALEAVTGFKTWSHGEAVAWGMLRAAELSASLGLARPEYVHRMREILDAYGFRLQAGRRVKSETVFRAMLVDKKRRKGKLRLVLQRRIGDTVVREVDEALILQTLRSSARMPG
jgi:3-dehydroquinate synthase